MPPDGCGKFITRNPLGEASGVAGIYRTRGGQALASPMIVENVMLPAARRSVMTGGECRCGAHAECINDHAPHMTISARGYARKRVLNTSEKRESDPRTTQYSIASCRFAVIQ